VHGVTAEMNVAARDEFFGIDLEANALEKGAGGEAGFGEYPRYSSGAEGGFDGAAESGGNAAAGEGGLREQKVEMAGEFVGRETGDQAVLFGDDGVDLGEARLPAVGVLVLGRPGGKLVFGVEGRGDDLDGVVVDLHDLVQIGGLVGAIEHGSLADRVNGPEGCPLRGVPFGARPGCAASPRIVVPSRRCLSSGFRERKRGCVLRRR
jgi:hypothetical protein